MRRVASVLLGSVIVTSACPVAAHHSFAMYDTQRLITVKGTIKSFQWTNPHALLWLIEETPDGLAREWSVELPTSPGALTRMGWTKHSLPAGERVIVELNPLRTGEHAGSFKKATLVSTGEVLTATAPPALADAGPR
jgi:Family of unknown function (DUF6152)